MILEGKTALISGGAGALGSGVVAVFLEAGAQVAVADRAGPGLDRLAQRHPEVLPLATDLLNAAAVANAVERTRFRFGRIDIAVQLAGGWFGAKVEETPPDRWREQLDLNLTTTFLVAHAVLPPMLEQ